MDAIKNEGPYNVSLKNAIRHLKSIGKIDKAKDIVEKTGYNKATVSEYIRGIVKASPDFEKEFEEKFGISLENFNGGSNGPNQQLSAVGVNITLQDYINLLHRENDRLFTLLNSTLSQIHSDQRAVLAHEKAWVEYEAEKEAGGNEQKKQEIMYKMNTLVHGKLGGKTAKGSPAETGK